MEVFTIELLGERLREERVRCGFSQAEVAETLFLTRQTISKWENNRSVPDIYNLMMLADVFSISVYSLTGMNEQLKEVEKESVMQNNHKQEKRKMKKRVVVAFLGLLSLVAIVSYLFGFGNAEADGKREIDEHQLFKLYVVADLEFQLIENWPEGLESEEMTYPEAVLASDSRLLSVELTDGTIVTDLSMENLHSLGLFGKDNP